jgi:hypothetical protein
MLTSEYPLRDLMSFMTGGNEADVLSANSHNNNNNNNDRSNDCTGTAPGGPIFSSTSLNAEYPGFAQMTSSLLDEEARNAVLLMDWQKMEENWKQLASATARIGADIVDESKSAAERERVGSVLLTAVDNVTVLDNVTLPDNSTMTRKSDSNEKQLLPGSSNNMSVNNNNNNNNNSPNNNNSSSSNNTTEMSALEQAYWNAAQDGLLTEQIVEQIVCQSYWDFPRLLPKLLDKESTSTHLHLFTEQCLALLSPQPALFNKLYSILQNRYNTAATPALVNNNSNNSDNDNSTNSTESSSGKQNSLEASWRWQMQLRVGATGEQIRLYSPESLINLARYGYRFPVLYWKYAVAHTNIAILKPLFVLSQDSEQTQTELRQQVDYALKYVAMSTRARMSLSQFEAALQTSQPSETIEYWREECLRSCTHTALTHELLFIRENLY